MILLKHFPGQNQAKIPHDHQVVKRALLHRFMSKGIFTCMNLTVSIELI